MDKKHVIFKSTLSNCMYATVKILATLNDLRDVYKKEM